MYTSHIVEKLKFGEKYILANIVVVPLTVKPSENDECHEHELPARNKYLTRDTWQSFVYRKLYEIFRKHFPIDGSDKEKDSPFQANQEYRLHCTERPYLQMKYEFRDKYFRNSLNLLFKEKQAILHESCIYVEISDQGRLLFNKVDDRDKTVLRLLKEINELKAANVNGTDSSVSPTSSKGSKHTTSEFEEYHPEPTKTPEKKCLIEEYVPLNRNGLSPGTKRTYKPSKITGAVKSVDSFEPDPYTPGLSDKLMKISYIPSSSPLSKLPKAQKNAKSGKAEQNLFGSDDEEYIPGNSSNENLDSKNESQKDMFEESDPNSPPGKEAKGIEGECLDKASRLLVAKREILPRSSKNSRAALPDSFEDKRTLTIKKKCIASRSEENLNNHIKMKNGIRKKVDQKREGSLKGHGKLEKLTKIAKQLSKAEVLDCTSLSKEEIIETFERYRQELHDIYLRFKDHTERQWKNSSELCYFTDLANVMDDEQKLAMLHHLEEAFVPETDRGKYTEFFTSSLLMEWALRIFMERHNFENRQTALDRIKQQETCYLASLPNDLLLKYQ